ncbi:MAG: hypothetical protein U0T84_12545 [Chitinophagales bacterium]
MKKKGLWVVLVLVGLPLLYVGGNIAVAYFTQLRPEPREKLEAQIPASSKKIIPVDSALTFFTWNIGYAGLGAETDFFYDDGKMVITPEPLVKQYMAGIDATIREHAKTDFVLIQEADRGSKRSYYIDEAAALSASLADHASCFAVNYDVKNLPFPWTEPLGRIYGGLLSLTSYQPTQSERIALANITDFPRRLFYLKRCLLMQRFPVANGKELIVVNTHFEAYDNGNIKRKQMALTKSIVEEEYARGNYVIIGGDWNIAPPDFNVHQWEKEKISDSLYFMNNDPNYIHEWKYVYDGKTPSNRKNNHAYDPATTFTTVIDYFFVSPNVQVDTVQGIHAQFRNSDHNPVRMTVRLK